MSIDCLYCLLFFFFKQKTAYEMRISDWSSDVCSSDLGGIGGVIDLRTRKPLDFDGFELSGSVRGRYETLADKIDPLVSALVSDRWNVGSGEMGLLLSGSYQERSFRSDVISNGAPSLRSDIIPGQQIYTPNGDYEPLIHGKSSRIGLQGAFQWKPNPHLAIFAAGIGRE